MSSADFIRLENRFVVPAPPEVTWTLLHDVPRIVPCVPGAELVEVVGPNAWKARMSVNVGPIGLQFDADVERTHGADDRSIVIIAKAREARGKGGAQATVHSSLAPGEDGSTNVVLVTEVTFDGAVAEVAVGPVVSDIARQLTRRFADCLAKVLQPGPKPARPRPAKPVGAIRLIMLALLRLITRPFRPKTY